MTASLEASFTRRFPAAAVEIDHLAVPLAARVTVVFGPSGAGKSTLLRCLAGLEQPDRGWIRFGGVCWHDSARRLTLPTRARSVGYVPQDYALFPHLTVAGNIGYGLRHAGRDARARRVAELLAWLGLEPLRARLPGSLSGGQQQRVALARALARRPALLLLDEPFGALDLPSRARLRGELRDLLKQARTPTLLVTHDRTEALALGDDAVALEAGRVLQRGPVHEVFCRPLSLGVARAVAIETIQPAQVRRIDAGLVTLSAAGHTLTALAPELPPGTAAVYLCIRAEDVILVQGGHGRSSPRNILPCVVRTLSPDGPMMRLELDCGFPLAALLTRQACAELDLEPGARVEAMIKAPQLHLIPR